MSPSLYDKIPKTLRDIERWIAWQYGTPRANSKPTKVPFSLHTLRAADPKDPATWGTFDDAVAAYQACGFDGIGFVFNSDGYVGIDLDNCRNRTTGEIEPRALSIIQELDSYTEVSPSGEGVKIFAVGEVPEIGRKQGNIEIYNSKRFFTVTGNHLADTPTTIEKRPEQITAFIREHFGEKSQSSTSKPPRPTSLDMLRTAPARHTDEKIFALLAKARNKAKFDRLFAGNTKGYESHSDADLALCGILAHYTSNPQQIDRIFRQSGLYRHKWVQKRGQVTYGQLTIDKAIEGSTRWKLECIKTKIFSSTDFRINTDRLVLHQLYDVAQNTSKVRISASVVSIEASERDIADAIGVTRTTVRDALHRLHDDGYITMRTRKGKRAKSANTYALPLDPTVDTTEGANTHPYRFTVGGGENMYGAVSAPSLLSALLAHDAFRHGALSKSCERFLAVILEHGVVKTLKDVMRLSGLKERTCKATAKRLQEVGLVVKTEAGWARGPNTLDAVAKSLGTWKKAQRQKDKHAAERRRFAKKMEDWNAQKLKNEEQREEERKVYLLEPEREERKATSDSGVPVSVPDVFIDTVMTIFPGADVLRRGSRAVAYAP